MNITWTVKEMVSKNTDTEIFICGICLGPHHEGLQATHNTEVVLSS